MPLSSDYIPNIFYNNRTVEAKVGCWIEYNMNTLVPNISVNSTNPNTLYYHIFPLDSVVKPFRPTKSGIKFATISSYDNNQNKNKTNYPSSKSTIYPESVPRQYYAGIDSDYKYYLTGKGESLNVSLKYVQSSINIVSAYSTGEYIQYQTNGAHGLTEGLSISISGFSNSALNCTSLQVDSVPEYNIFRVLKAAAIVSKVTQSVTGSVDAKTKYAIANKIIATFNKDHYLPSTCTIKIKSARTFPAIVSASKEANTDRVLMAAYRQSDLVIDGVHYDRYAYSNPQANQSVYPGDVVNITGFTTDTTFNKTNAVVKDVINGNLIYIDVPHVSGTTNKSLDATGTLKFANARIKYTTASDHGLLLGETISISGLKTSAFNLTNQTVTGRSGKVFIIQNAATGEAVTSGKGLILTEDSEVTKSDIAIPADGKVALYFDGSDWSVNAPADPLTENAGQPGNPLGPLTFGTPRYLSQITIDAAGASNKFIGLIELAGIYIKDISSDIVSFSVTKDSSSSSDMIPVGLVTANNLNMQLTKYDQDTSIYRPYSPSDLLDTSYIYLYKNVKLTPFVKIYDGYGAIIGYDERNNFFRLKQGEYYISDYTIDTYGQVTVNALDGSKYLMEKVAPDLLLEDYPVTSIIRILLDSVGFVNYNFNVFRSGSTIVDGSIPYVSSWWTDGSKTVWQCIQELCQDMQINAIFDDQGILQFYTRDFMYSPSKSVSWNFYHDQEGSRLPNIISFDQKIIPSANEVHVKWQTPLSSKYTGSSTQLWSSPVTFLAAGGLRRTILADTSPENTILMLSFETIDKYSVQQTVYSFSGYLLIDSEVIEYDAIQYQCVLEEPIGGQSIIYPWITSQSEVSKYLSLSKPGYSDPTSPALTAYFKPTGLFRVKKRGALGTTPAKHNATGSLSDILSNGWESVSLSWKEKK